MKPSTKTRKTPNRYNLIREFLDKRKKENEKNGKDAEKQFSQYWLAKETGLTYTTVTSYYHGRSEPTLKNLFEIARALEVSPKDLLNC